MAIDLKYGRVTTEHGNLGHGEPVVIFRAQDRLVPAVLELYRALCEQAGSPERHLQRIDEARQVIEDWQATHHTQTPQSKEH